MKRCPLLILLACLSCALWPFPAHSGPAEIERVLRLEQEQAEQREQEIRRLSKEQNKLSQRLRSIDERIRVNSARVADQQAALDKIRADEARTREQYFGLEREKKRTEGELMGLMATLWPVHMQNIEQRFRGVGTWDAADRRFTWLAGIYKATRDKLAQAREQARKVAENLEAQRELEQEAGRRLAVVNKTKDDLLRDKLLFRSRLSEVRTKRTDLETELRDILEAIQELNYQLSTQKTKRFAGHKRNLPWPVAGKVVGDFDLEADPPMRGLGMSVAEAGEPVKCVFWGKVVHNDTLRGFGQVIIVYHGYDYYSLYAFLSESFVQSGQEVEKDETIGRAGYYPRAQGPGLYFELRFRQKPINPIFWLSALRKAQGQ